MDTLRPELWHKSSSGCSVGASELEHWKDVPFILILICTGVEVAIKRTNRWFTEHSPGQNEKHFYCFLDETVAKDIWGEDFHRLAITIKEKKLKEASQTVSLSFTGSIDREGIRL